MRRVRDLVDSPRLGVLHVPVAAEELSQCADRMLGMRRGALRAELPGGIVHRSAPHVGTAQGQSGESYTPLRSSIFSPMTAAHGSHRSLTGPSMRRSVHILDAG
jgi:hypothetical protein